MKFKAGDYIVLSWGTEIRSPIYYVKEIYKSSYIIASYGSSDVYIQYHRVDGDYVLITRMFEL